MCWLEIFCDLVEFGQFQKQLKQMWRGICITNLSSSVQELQGSTEAGRAWGLREVYFFHRHSNGKMLLAVSE